jgi:pyruvate dehydrogenase E2 component (dihydrolipoamide acetyltransferase)
MSIELKMPALSPTMEEGTLAKWLVKVGDSVSSGDLLAEIETDKATMEFEAIDEGVIKEILVAEGTDGVKVGTVIAVIAGEDDDEAAPAPTAASPVVSKPEPAKKGPFVSSAVETPVESAQTDGPLDDARGERKVEVPAHAKASGDRVKASPLAKRIAAEKGVDLATLTGTGPNGRIVKADLDGLGESVLLRKQEPGQPPATPPALLPTQEHKATDTTGIPHEVIKLSNMRKTIARRLTESKQTVPHIYLTVDVRLDALLKLRGELNASLEARNIKLSVNDMLIKALGAALMAVPKCNVSFAGDNMLQYSRADISVAVSIPGGLITPIVTDAGNKSISTVSTEMAALAAKAKDGKLQPHEFQGGTASLSNMGMMGIKQFDAVINPPQGMILAIGAGEKRPYIVDDALAIATVMSATGSFDHRAIDGADGAMLMKVFKELVEKPLGLVA